MVSDRWSFWLKCLLFALISIILMQYEALQSYPSLHLPSNIFVKTLLPKIGDALLIAVILALVVDLPAKKEMLADFLFDSSTHIIGRQLPEDVREELREYLNVPFLRPLWKITYELSEEPSLSAVKLQSTYQGEMENLTTRKRGYEFSAILDDTWMNGVPLPELRRVSILRKGKDLVTEPVAGLREYRQEVEIHPGAEQRCELLLECIEHFPETYEYAMINEATAQRVELTVRYPRNLFQVEVALSAGADGKMSRKDFDLYSTWIIEKPILPGQCILTKWKRIHEATFEAKPVLQV
jgi:hypothetical protein